MKVTYLVSYSSKVLFIGVGIILLNTDIVFSGEGGFIIEKILNGTVKIKRYSQSYSIPAKEGMILSPFDDIIISPGARVSVICKNERTVIKESTRMSKMSSYTYCASNEPLIYDLPPRSKSSFQTIPIKF